MILRARWVLPIDRAPIDRGWMEIHDSRIARLGEGQPPGPATDLGDVALMPGLVNAHTHLELSWMAGLIPPAASMNDWIRALMEVRRAGPAGGEAEIVETMRAAATAMSATGTVLVGDISNTLASARVLAEAGIGGVVFNELIGFNPSDPLQMVRDARSRVEGLAREFGPALAFSVVAHAPYSVAPSLFREIVNHADRSPLTIHLAESAEELEFLRTGGGPIRETLEQLGVWTDTWRVPQCDPVRFVADVGYLRPNLLVVHGVHLTDDGLDRLRAAGARLVTCPRSNTWVGGGPPRIARFYASRLPVAIGTDSLASAPTLNIFDEMAEVRRIAPEVSASAILDSATRRGAEALGFGQEFGTLAAGKRASVVAVDVPEVESGDVEEYLVSGVPASAIRRVA